jgi:hypothetical protein
VVCGKAVEKLYIVTGEKDLWVKAGRDWLNEVAVSGEQKFKHISDCDIPICDPYTAVRTTFF